MEFCCQSWNFPNFGHKFYQIGMFFVTIKELSMNVESLHFLTFSAKHSKCKMDKIDGHGKLRDGHAKYFVKSVGTLR